MLYRAKYLAGVGSTRVREPEPKSHNQREEHEQEIPETTRAGQA